MRPTATALRAGFARGLIELRQSFTGAGLLGHLFWPVVTLVAIFFLRGRSFGASGFTLGTLALPSVLGMFVALGMLLVVQYLSAEREDGTLLRAKAIPNGIGGYFVGKLVTVSGTILAYLAILLLPGLLIVDGLEVGSIGSWLTLAWVLGLGWWRPRPSGPRWGADRQPRGPGDLSLPVRGLIAVAGIFDPLTALPGWPQPIAQGSPMDRLAWAWARPCCRPRRSASSSAGPGGPGDRRGAGRLGRGRPDRGADRAAPDGAAGVGLNGGRTPPEAPATDQMMSGQDHIAWSGTLATMLHAAALGKLRSPANSPSEANRGAISAPPGHDQHLPHPTPSRSSPPGPFTATPSLALLSARATGRPSSHT